MPSGIKIILLHIQVRVWMKADGSTMQSGEWNSLPVGLCVSNSMVNRTPRPFEAILHKKETQWIEVIIRSDAHKCCSSANQRAFQLVQMSI